MISIIICTYKRKNDIIECVDSLLSQNYKDYEIIVVDNYPYDGSSELLKKKFGKKIRLISNEKDIGLSRSKNLAISLARGNIIAFTDDDCVASEDWLEKAIESFSKNNDICGVGGLIKPYGSVKFPKWWRYDMNWLIGMSTTTEHFTCGGNMLFYKDVLNRIGNFDTGIDREEGNLLFQEDTMLFEKVRKAGYKFLFDKSLVVYHKVHPERLNINYLIKRSKLDGYSFCKRNKTLKIFFKKIPVSIFHFLLFLITLNLNQLAFFISDISYLSTYIKEKK